MSRIVCQVLHRPNRVTFIWSEGAASFEPYHLEGQEVEFFYQTARSARRLLARLVHGGDAQTALELAQAGHQLYQAIFRHHAHDPQAREIQQWLNNLRDRKGVASLDLLGDVPGLIPWNVVYDQEPTGDPSALKSFWGFQYALAVGKRVNPLRIACVLDSPQVLLAADPNLMGRLAPERRNQLGDWAIAHELTVVDSGAGLKASLEKEAPDILYLFARFENGQLRVGEDSVSLVQLRDLLAGAGEGNPDPVVFLQVCGETADQDFWECFVGAAVSTLSGVVLCEVPASPELANTLGLEALSRLFQNQRLGQAVQGARAGQDLAGLAYSAFCPSHVKIAGDDTEPDVPGPELLPLPEYPYRPLVPYESEDRALFTGREDETVRCAGLLDEAGTHGLILHGGGGVGKTSFLRAGLIPHLETEAVGYLALRDRTPEETIGVESDYPVIALRPGFDLAGQLAEALCAFCAQPYRYTTPLGKAIYVDLPVILKVSLGGDATTAITAQVPTGAGDIQPEENQTAVWERLRSQANFLPTLLDKLTIRLPFELLVVIEQGEDLVLQRSGSAAMELRRDLEIMESLLRSAARCKVLLEMRTEYLGRLMDHVAVGSERWRFFFLDELDKKRLHQVMVLPVATEPVPYASEIPHQKYQFDFDAELVGQVIVEVHKAAGNRHQNPLPMLQTLCAELYERSKKIQDGLLTIADYKPVGPAAESVARFVAKKIKDLPVAPPDRIALRKVMEKLYLRHTDGTVTRNLVATQDIVESWKSTTPLETVIDAAATEGLVEINQLQVAGRPELFVGLPQESLARTADGWDEDRRRQAFGSNRIADTLWIMVPLIFLVGVITWTMTRNSDPVLDQDLDELLSVNTAVPYHRVSSIELDKFIKLTTKYENQVSLDQWSIYVGDLVRAEQAWKNDNLLQARQIMRTLQSVKYAPLRDFEWLYLWNKIMGKGFEKTGQKGLITSVAISPDGIIGASASKDGTVKVWNLQKVEEIATLTTHVGPVLAVAFSPDGKTIASGGADKIIRLWNIPAGQGKSVQVDKEQKALSGHTGEVRALAFGPQGLVSGGDDKLVITWDAATGKEVNVFKEHAGAIQALALAPDGKMIASAGADNKILLHDGLKTLHTIAAPGTVAALSFALDGKTLASGGTDKQGDQERGLIRFWDTATGKETGNPIQHASGIFALAYVPNSKLLASAGKDNLLRLWDPATGRNVSSFKGHLGFVGSFAASASGTTLISADRDGAVKFWSFLPPESFEAHRGPVQALLFAIDDKVLVSGGKDGTVKFWDPATGQLIQELTGLGSVTSLAAIPSQKNAVKLAAGTKNDKNEGEIRLWEVTWVAKEGVTKDALKIEPLAVLKEHAKGVTCVAYSTDGKILASGSADKSVILWDLEGDKKDWGTKKKILLGHEAEVRCLAFPSDGPVILISGGADGQIHQWDVKTAKEFRPSFQAHVGSINALGSFNYAWFTTVGDDQSTKFWEWRFEKPPAIRSSFRTNSQAITSLAYNSDRNLLVTGSLDQTLKLINTMIDEKGLTTFYGEERFTFTGLNTPILAVAVSLNNMILAGAGENGTIILREAHLPR